MQTRSLHHTSWNQAMESNVNNSIHSHATPRETNYVITFYSNPRQLQQGIGNDDPEYSFETRGWLRRILAICVPLLILFHPVNLFVYWKVVAERPEEDLKSLERVYNTTLVDS